VNRFVGYSLVLTTINYNTGHITVIIAHKIKSSIPAFTRRLLGNRSQQWLGLDSGFTILFLATNL
jgi:hypothetical protein